jgi:3'-phosphoadenosine 5'-phosphosulfate (PAPS) 3'-phosphatase
MPTDLVTEVDRECERWLAARPVELRPDDAVLGEEGAERAAAGWSPAAGTTRRRDRAAGELVAAEAGAR